MVQSTAPRPVSHASSDNGTQRHARLVALTSLIFSVTFVLALLLVDSSPHLTDLAAAFTAFYDHGSTALVTTGLYLVPFAGIAFLWNMTALRQLISNRTVTSGSMPYALQLLGGVVFVVLLFTGTATAGGVALLTELGSTALPPVDVTRALLAIGYGMVFVYSVRGAGMFVITSTTLLLRATLMPRWVAVLSYLAATVMLISTTLNPAVVLLLPCWAVLIGVLVVIRTRTPDEQRAHTLVD
ncbi:hypothetical protein [uncultured Jatrophihabitans sp.]|uniref:hypothetical protein n=1 Tax=uncultured Jatrophihabitans sp. TaxID=1610747 RepID=UPI0035CBB8AF